MGFSLCSNLLQEGIQNALPAPQVIPKPIAPANSLKAIEQNAENSNVSEHNAIVPFNPNMNVRNEPEDPILWDEGFDLMAAIAETEQVELQMSQIATKSTENTTTSVSKQMVKRTSPNVPMMFNNCKIEGNITINLQK